MRKNDFALLIPAYNEELVIKQTIIAAHKAGISYKHIYVVSDGSKDNTYDIAKKYLKNNAAQIKNIGKGNAIKEGIKRFRLIDRYNWISITDADTLLDKEYKPSLTKTIQRLGDNHNIAAICGQVMTIKSTWISHYRSFEYGIGQDLYKKVESFFDLILIMPGCCTTFNSAILDEVWTKGDHINDTLVEDYDLTMEIHKNTKGKILYVPEIIVWTQEPETLKVYVKQLLRWHRGWFQVAKKRIKFPFKMLDIIILYFTIDPLIFVAEFLVLVIISILKANFAIIASIFLTDIITLFAFCIYVAIAKKRYEILAMFPLVYFLRVLNIPIFVRAAFDVMVFKKFPLKTTSWDTPRYLIQQ